MSETQRLQKSLEKPGNARRVSTYVTPHAAVMADSVVGPSSNSPPAIVALRSSARRPAFQQLTHCRDNEHSACLPACPPLMINRTRKAQCAMLRLRPRGATLKGFCPRSSMLLRFHRRMDPLTLAEETPLGLRSGASNQHGFMVQTHGLRACFRTWGVGRSDSTPSVKIQPTMTLHNMTI
jgi:hypothetical protein